MGFEGLLGNPRLKENLQSSIRRGKIAHFYMISGPEGAGKKTLARLLAAAMLCTGEEKPCLRCAACRKVMGNAHPDVITVEDPEKKTLPVQMVRQARADMYIRPNEGARKIYVFPQELRPEGQNALLKILEEPPEYGVFLLLTDNPQKLLPTVRSRCTELKLTGLSEELLRSRLKEDFPQADNETLEGAIQRSGGYLGQALQLMRDGIAADPQTETFARCYAQRDPVALAQLLSSMERWKRDQILPVLQRWTELLQQAVASRSGIRTPSPLAREIAARRTAGEMMEAIGHLQKVKEYTQGNVSVAAVCGYLTWNLR